MPELPEVETIVQELNECSLIGSKILQATIYWHRSVVNFDQKGFSSRLVNQTITHISRRGKWIVITLDQDTILIHLRMTGKLFFSKNAKPLPHERVRLKLDDGQFLHFEDPRKFGKWMIFKDPSEKLNELGLEPLNIDFTFKAFDKVLSAHNQSLKVFLLNQKYIAGLGNIYVDEALYEAKLHPLTKTVSLTPNERKALHQAIIWVLSEGVKNRGTSLGKNRVNYQSVSGTSGSNQNHLKVFRKEGKPCPNCGNIIIKLTVAQRGTHICTSCQPNQNQA